MQTNTNPLETVQVSFTLENFARMKELIDFASQRFVEERDFSMSLKSYAFWLEFMLQNPGFNHYFLTINEN